MGGRANRSSTTGESGCCASSRPAPDGVQDVSLTCRGKPRRIHPWGETLSVTASIETQSLVQDLRGPFARDLPEGVVKIDADPDNVADLHYETACRVRGCLAGVSRSMLPWRQIGRAESENTNRSSSSSDALPEKDSLLSMLKTDRLSSRHTKASIRESRRSCPLSGNPFESSGTRTSLSLRQFHPVARDLDREKPGQMRVCHGRKRDKAAAAPAQPKVCRYCG
ncbi:uncharacterized protein B0H64DRAFT_34724 [Chaetomium fimeti]|uniref:Uncharacterized protein n=1 Tax=Chaetomium fimeti TaxID=1854472 RepID=A0AAE0HRG1_9PEZI|nr:hypothetical protein B0H64DRAFT_34724 [Chaetomium fimeti]